MDTCFLVLASVAAWSEAEGGRVPREVEGESSGSSESPGRGNRGIDVEGNMID